MENLKRAGARNLVFGIFIILAASSCLRYLISNKMFYNNELLFDYLFVNNAAKLSKMCIVPCCLPCIAFVIMYFVYVSHLDFRDYKVAGRNWKYALYTGLCLLVAEILIAFIILPLIAEGKLTVEEATYADLIMQEYRKNNLWCMVTDMVLYALCAVVFRPEKMK